LSLGTPFMTWTVSLPFQKNVKIHRFDIAFIIEVTVDYNSTGIHPCPAAKAKAQPKEMVLRWDRREFLDGACRLYDCPGRGDTPSRSDRVKRE